MKTKTLKWGVGLFAYCFCCCLCWAGAWACVSGLISFVKHDEILAGAMWIFLSADVLYVILYFPMMVLRDSAVALFLLAGFLLMEMSVIIVSAATQDVVLYSVGWCMFFHLIVWEVFYYGFDLRLEEAIS